jgi:ring-1,2-phenylacetyl-CoA epoxidase subunit PaaE
MPDSHSYIQLRIEQIISETPQAKTFVLKQVSGKKLVYKSGQFLNFVFPKHHGESRRSYSIAASAESNESLAITVKYVENGEYSRYLIDHAREGEVLLCAGVSGFFILPENIKAYQQLFFFAAGSGITPVFSLIKSALLLYPFLKINLVYSNRSKGETIFYDALSGLQEQYADRFSILFLFSTSRDLMRSRLNSFMISGMMQEIVIQPLDKVLFYVCGPFEYMDNVIITLLTEGVPKANIKKENFANFVPAIKQEPPDKDRHKVFIRIRNQQIELDVQYPVSILQEAKKQGLHLPYSCESGQCGSCAARCRQGRIWMFYNEVLTDKDLQEGLVLTCTGFPVGGDVELEYE